MEIWIGFLLLSFLAGSRATKSGRRERTAVALAGCIMVAALLSLERFA